MDLFSGELSIGFQRRKVGQTPVGQMAAPGLVGGIGQATLTLSAAPAGTGIYAYGYEITSASDPGFAAPVAMDFVAAADRGTPIVVAPLPVGAYIARCWAVNAAGGGPPSPASSSAAVTAIARPVESGSPNRLADLVPTTVTVGTPITPVDLSRAFSRGVGDLYGGAGAFASGLGGFYAAHWTGTGHSLTASGGAMVLTQGSADGAAVSAPAVYVVPGVYTIQFTVDANINLDPKWSGGGAGSIAGNAFGSGTVTRTLTVTAAGMFRLQLYVGAVGATSRTIDNWTLTGERALVMLTDRPEKSWTSTQAQAAADAWGQTAMLGGQVYAVHNPWGTGSMGAGASWATTALRLADGRVRVRNVWSGVSAADGTIPIGAPGFVAGKHDHWTTPVNPFAGNLLLSAITEWKARGRYVRETANAGQRDWAAFQTYCWAAGDPNANGTIGSTCLFDVQVRLCNDQKPDPAGGAYTATVDGRSWRVYESLAFGRAGTTYLTFTPPEGQNYADGVVEIDMRAFVAHTLARHQTRFPAQGVNDVVVSGIEFWTEIVGLNSLLSAGSSYLDRFGYRLDNVAYAEWDAPAAPDGLVSVTADPLPAGLAMTGSVLSGTAAAGSGGVLKVAVVGTDAAGAALGLTRDMTVIEAAAVASVAIVNDADGSANLTPGSLARAVVVDSGWPAPTIEIQWGDQGGGYALGTGETFVVSASGVTQLQCRARVAPSGPWVTATPVTIVGGVILDPLAANGGTGYLARTMSSDASPNNLLADSTVQTIAFRALIPASAVGAAQRVQQTAGRGYVQITSTGALEYWVYNPSNTLIGRFQSSASIADPAERVFVISVNTASGQISGQVTVDGAALPGTWLTALTAGTIDHTRATGMFIGAGSSGGNALHADVRLRWLYYSGTVAKDPALFGTGASNVDPATIGDAQVLIRNAAAFVAGDNTGTPQGGGDLDFTPTAGGFTSVAPVVPGAGPFLPDAIADAHWGLAARPDATGDKLDVTIFVSPTTTPGVTAIQYSTNGGSTWTNLVSGAAGFASAGVYTVSGFPTGVPVSMLLRAVNAQGNGPPSSAKVATPASTGGTTLAPDQWRLASAVTDGATLYATVDLEGTHAPRFRVDGGAPVIGDYRAPGVFTLAGLAGGSRSVEVSIDGGVTWSAAKTGAPTAQSDTRIGCWADGAASRQLSATPSATGANQSTALTGGGEWEVVHSATSLYETTYLGPAGGNQVGNWLIYDPLGSADDLKPGEARAISASTPTGTTTFVHLGRAGMATRPVMALWGLDADGDPVPFRFDRQMQGGQLPDGRPFVVGPARFVCNGKNPTLVTPDPVKGYAVVSDRGAVICVVSRPGIIPPVSAAATDLALSHAYVRRAGAFTFTGWDDGLAAAGGAAGVTVRPNFENVGIYWNHSGTSRVKVRFRKQGTTPWYPALDLDYHSKDFSAYSAYMAAKHRGAIFYLEPNTTYEIQLKDGSTYRSFTATTRSYKPAKVSAALGVVNGNVTVSRSGNIVSVARAGLSTLTLDVTGGKMAELRNGVVRNGTITFNADTDDVILRDVDVFGAPSSCVIINANCSNIRRVRGSSAIWGRRDQWNQWARHQDNVTRVVGGYPGGLGRISMLGGEVRSPRVSANLWSEDTQVTPQHPWGASVFGGEGRDTAGLRDGQTVIDGLSIAPHPLRSLYDVLGPVGRNTITADQAGGIGPDSVVVWNYISEPADDGAEMEGSSCNLWFAHNRMDIRIRRGGANNIIGQDPAQGPHYGVAIGDVSHGPAYFMRNVYTLEVLKSPVFEGCSVMKVQPQGDSNLGRIFTYHETGVGLGGARWNRGIAGSQVNGATLRHDRANCYYRVAAASGLVASTANYVQDTVGGAAYAHDADMRPTGASIAGTGVSVPNVNDGGPFYVASPNVGALV